MRPGRGCASNWLGARMRGMQMDFVRLLVLGSGSCHHATASYSQAGSAWSASGHWPRTTSLRLQRHRSGSSVRACCRPSPIRPCAGYTCTPSHPTDRTRVPLKGRPAGDVRCGEIDLRQARARRRPRSARRTAQTTNQISAHRRAAHLPLHTSQAAVQLAVHASECVDGPVKHRSAQPATRCGHRRDGGPSAGHRVIALGAPQRAGAAQWS